MAEHKKTGVAQTVAAAVTPAIESLGLEVWDVRYVKEGAGMVLRIFIDRDGGVGLNDCEAASRAAEQIIDELDPIAESYCLEVSSPGLGRRLTRAEHFERFTGAEVELRMYHARGGSNCVRGVLGGLQDKAVLVDGVAYEQSNISLVKLCDDEDLFK